MEKGFEIDFSEIINDQDDSGAFVDSNILESARQELENEKRNLVTNQIIKSKSAQPNYGNEENRYRHKTQLNIKVDK